MGALTNTAYQNLCKWCFVASSSPSDLDYWIGGRFSGSLGLHWQLLGFIAIVVMIAWKSAEMQNKPMVIAGALSLISLIAFVCTGLTLPKSDAYIVCFVLNGFQCLLVASLTTHWRIRTMSRF